MKNYDQDMKTAMLNNVNWNSILKMNDVDLGWSKFRECFVKLLITLHLNRLLGLKQELNLGCQGNY